MTSAVVASLDRHHITSLPSMPCDPREHDCAFPMSLDPTESRLAWADPSTVHVVELHDGKVVPIHDEPLRLGDHGGLAFIDPQTVFAWSTRGVHVLREGAARPRTSLLSIGPPPGFRPAKFREVDGISELTLSDFESESESVRLGLVARFRRDEHDTKSSPRKGRKAKRWHRSPQIDVWVYALDASELDADDLDSFSSMAIERYAPKSKVLRSWEDATGRSVELVVFQRGGCDELDRYIRVSEREGSLYQIVIEVAPGTNVKDIPFDAVYAPLQGSDGPRRVTAISHPFNRGPC